MKAFALILLLALETHAGIRVIGNGGNTFGPRPAGVQEIRRLLQSSRFHIRAWATSKERYDRSLPAGEKGMVPMDTAAFLGFLDTVRIQLREDSPCPSNFGHREGSVISLHPPVICLSGQLMASLPVDSAPREMEALIVHEISHLLGANEEEAVRIQTDYLKTMRSLTRSRIELDLQRKRHALFEVSTSLEDHLKNDVLRPEETDRLVFSLLGSLALYGPVFADPLDAVPLYADGGLVEGIQRWLRLIRLQLPTAKPREASSRTADDHRLAKVRRDGEVQLTEFSSSFFRGAALRAKRLKTMEDVNLELKRLRETLEELQSQLQEESRKTLPLTILRLTTP